MFEGRKILLGIASICCTNDDMKQLGGKYPTDPQVLKRAMYLRGLKIASQWFFSFLRTNTYEENE